MFLRQLRLQQPTFTHIARKHLSTTVPKMAAPKVINVDVTSDTVCPFCILGITQMKLGAEAYNKEHPDAPVKIEHRLHPYQLRPEMPDAPVSRNQNMDKTYGSGGRGPGIRENLRTQFAAVGLTYAPDAQLANSNRSHRLETLARDKKGNEASWDVGMDLMNAYQIDGKSPSDPASVAAIGVKHGLFIDQAEGEAWVKGSDLDAQTAAGYATARKQGISGVPNFVFQDKYATSGAIGVDAFKSVFAQIIQKEKI